jgi:uncharacterized protein (TIGR03435 family)
MSLNMLANRTAALLFALAAAHAQSPELRFDVSSVKQNHAADCRGRWDFTAFHATVTAENAPLRRIISRAYRLTDDRISGPAWIDSQCYDIRAKAPAGTTDRDLMPMLQALLLERFHLIARRESDERPVLVLVIDKGGTKLSADGDKNSKPATGDGKVLFMVRHVADLCERLAMVTGHPVLDKTGLDGSYEIVLTYIPYGTAAGDPSDSGFDIFSAVRDQLGLKLEPQRAMVETLKIDSIDKVPTRN